MLKKRMEKWADRLSAWWETIVLFEREGTDDDETG